MTAAQKNSSPLSYVEVAEQKRLNIACEQGVPCKKWGPYLSDLQRGTVREDYGTTIRRATERFSILVWLATVACIASICTEHTADARRHDDLHRKHVE